MSRLNPRPTKTTNEMTSRSTAEGRPRATWDRASRLVRKSDFEAVYHCGREPATGGGGRLKSPQFVVFYRANRGERSRFGISVKRALGGAVVRNRIRRRIREILRRNLLEIPSGWDFVMHPRSSVASRNFAALEAELVKLLRGLPALAGTAAPESGRMRDSSPAAADSE
jgi:ribonuclease P protein component